MTENSQIGASRSDLCPAEIPVLLIPVDLIDVPMNRLRSLKLLQADAIGAAIVADGQYDPITVVAVGERYALVDGLHRLEGCRLHEVRLIEARVVADDPAARLRQEVLSAWARADHDVFDTAAQVSAIAGLTNALEGSEGEPSAIIALGLRWDERAAETLGMSRRSIFNYLKVHRHFEADQKALLRGLEQAGELVPLLRLAGLPPAEFARAMAGLADGSFANIAAALAPAEEAAPTVFKKKSDAFLTFLRAKASPRERADLMRQLRDEYLDDGRPRAKSGAKAN
jgi:ParB-like chromosome segregation protein Spo0J